MAREKVDGFSYELAFEVDAVAQSLIHQIPLFNRPLPHVMQLEILFRRTIDSDSAFCLRNRDSFVLPVAIWFCHRREFFALDAFLNLVGVEDFALEQR